MLKAGGSGIIYPQIAMIPLSRPTISGKELAAIRQVLQTRHLAEGPIVAKFQTEFAKFIGARHAIAVCNGTAGLHTALLALGIDQADSVITSSFSFIATANAVLFCGARPIFCDIDHQTFNISPTKIEEILKKRSGIKALLITHLFGVPCDMDKVLKLKRKYNLYLIEDCCQAHGAKYKGKSVGSFGDIAVFSFYGTKNMTTGEGGMLTTNSSKLKNRCLSIINHGRSSRFVHKDLGYNYRMTDLQAAIGLIQLKKLKQLNNIRLKNAKFYMKKLSDIDWLELPTIPKNTSPCFHQFTIKVEPALRDKFIEYLRKKGIGAAAIYPLPIHKQPLYVRLGLDNPSQPVSEKIAKEVVSIPVHPELKNKDLSKIVNAIKNFKA